MVLLLLASSLLFQGTVGCGLKGPCIELYNHCPHTIFPGMKIQSDNIPPNYDGWRLLTGETMDILLNLSWTDISVWARTDCDDLKNNWGCVTGDCGSTMACATEPSTPFTRANIHIDFGLLSKTVTYEISLLSGYNVKMSMKATRLTGRKKRSVEDENYLLGLIDFSCSTIKGCNTDFLDYCPPSLLKSTVNEGNIGCFHPCEKTGDPGYCCTSPYNTSTTCSTALQPGNLLSSFQSFCPEYKAYKYDNKAKTCTFPLLQPSYEIHFC